MKSKIDVDWREVRLIDVIQFNPRESIKRGTIAKKVGMAKLIPFQKALEGFELAEYKSGTKFRNGDTLLARITPCLENGKTAQVNILEEDEIGFGSTEFIVLREKDELSINDFIYYFALSPIVKDTAIKSMTGTSGRQRAQRDVIENTVVKLPFLQEQKAIANTLSSLDDKIELNNKINENLEEQAQAIFKHWFVDFEFPDENGNPYKSSGGEMVESELGMIPKGWEVKKIKNISQDIVLGKTPPTSDQDNFGGGIPFLTIPDMHNKVYVDNTARTLSEKGVNTQANKTVPKNSICVSCIATPGLVTITKEPTQTNQQINTIIPNIKYTYVYSYMKSISNKIISLGAGGTTTNNLNKTQFSNIDIIVPSNGQIEEYHYIVERLFNAIGINQQESQTLVQLRDTLLPKMMSGQLRIPLG